MANPKHAVGDRVLHSTQGAGTITSIRALTREEAVDPHAVRFTHTYPEPPIGASDGVKALLLAKHIDDITGAPVYMVTFDGQPEDRLRRTREFSEYGIDRLKERAAAAAPATPTTEG